MDSVSKSNRLNGVLATPSSVAGRSVQPDPEVTASNSRRRFTAAYKERILREAEACRGTGQIASLLRREGLYSSHLAAWRKQLTDAPKRRGRKPTDPALAAQIEQVRKLQKENAQLGRRLAQAEAIIDIQKKVAALLGIPLNHPDSEGSD
jgi:transposase